MAGPLTPGDRGPHPRVGAILVAAGASRRMGGRDKVFLPLLGKPLIGYTLQAFHASPLVDAIVLVLSQHNVADGRRLVQQAGFHKVRDICTGGQRRQDSVRCGLERLADMHWVLVHDGARPCVDASLIERGLRHAAETGAATAAVPVKDTIKLAGADMLVDRTLPRDQLWAVQTPQVFLKSLLMEAHQRVVEDVTDDASMVERMGGKVRLFMGSYENIKVTTPEDIAIAEALLRARGVAGGGTW